MSHSRRWITTCVAYSATLMSIICLGFAGITTASAAPLTVTLLGTGSPVPSTTRFSQSILVEADEQKLLFDLGRGVLIRLHQLGIPARDITASFITHMHSDHISGLSDLWMTGWLGTAYGSRTTPMVIYGPKGTENMAKHLTLAFSENIRIRKADEKLPADGIKFAAHDIEPGPVYEEAGIRVTAFESNHGELIKPNYGYVIEYDGKKVVISSDTTYDERVADAGRDADLLIHEVAFFDPDLFDEYPIYRRVQAHHSTPEEAGRIFSLAKPTLAVFTHIIVHAPAQSDVQPAAIVVKGARQTYSGPLIAGVDLMQFVIDDQGTVTVSELDGETATSFVPAAENTTAGAGAD